MDNAHSLMLVRSASTSKYLDWLIIESSPSRLFNAVCQQMVYGGVTGKSDTAGRDSLIQSGTPSSSIRTP